jgi:hypothetical protein
MFIPEEWQSLRTTDLHIDGNAPIRGCLGRIHVEIAESHFSHAVDDGSSIFVPSDTYLVVAVRRVESVDEPLVTIRQRRR